MGQSIFGLGIGGAGIVGTLIVAGILLHILNVSQIFSTLALGGGVVIGIVLGLLGIFAVLSRLH